MIQKLLLTAGIVAAWLAVRFVIRTVEDRLHERASRRAIWASKSIDIVLGIVAIFAIAATWFHDPAHLATFTGLVGGGIAFASQKMFQSLAGFLVIVFGRSFDIGDRIEMGGVRGDVLDIGLLKTTVMEMGVPAALRPQPNHWIGGRQYTGRIVTISNSAVFDEPVFNYSRNFDFLWEEMQFPIKYGTDLQVVEQILVEVAREETKDIAAYAQRQLEKMRKRVVLAESHPEPAVFIRLTDNWIELSLRFVSRTHGTRDLTNRISRRVLAELQKRGIELASGTYAIVELPEVRVVQENEERAQHEPPALHS